MKYMWWLIVGKFEKAENLGKRFAGYHSTNNYAERSVCGSQSIVE